MGGIGADEWRPLPFAAAGRGTGRHILKNYGLIRIAGRRWLDCLAGPQRFGHAGSTDSVGRQSTPRPRFQFLLSPTGKFPADCGHANVDNRERRLFSVWVWISRRISTARST